ncbi:tRNA (N(6)-L-threonylcarbamoyladenosine(37)-C(2))-methylthiotransferase MtaB [Geomonas paludis]|uniref:Threonylcarbamoyladenosine tRNA methylthiotransferase MtaB n=1 Tax=Geomonas paludis TaxID=2740185 RepID=A0A6V8MUE1_9BACT|nr:tRNA (N(6)-L-threonylcarbamoyladenosine(37)-C(2))-methylthiotransferase MtaB [Geomonas paludis]UPU37657.1 tRNA (N(6)-L-threonylcarbamoyladenosine(37)-C(2))-methylthiotransferase MtaB [Geomonas paludis]GFO63808.1 tRNA (N(6)-L-threonylcarbamoyladenosine(37)-C(2))-methylthiotran sferase MtaB [Geomonas paludis]
MNKRIAITTLGCKINQFESAAMTEALEQDGYSFVPFSESADIYVINSCTVTAKTDAESRRLIRRATRTNPEARVVITGCYAQMAGDELLKLPGVNLILGNSEKKDIVGFIKGLGNEPQAVVSDISQQRSGERTQLESFAEHTRAFLQVQNGCDARCAYCIVPYARGASRSVAPQEALDGMAAFAAKGFQEIVLTGIHLGAYGLDLEPATDLLGLMRLAERQGVVRRLRVGSVEPTEVPAEMIEFMAASKMVCPHLHLPLQSGSDGVLARMNRGYDTALFRSVVEALVAAMPDVSIGSDVIAGFPGETDQEFQETLSFIDSLPLAYLHVFPFSQRPGTPAATMAAQVQPRVIKERAEALRILSEKKKAEYAARFVGRELQVLVQKDEGGRKGLSRNYLAVLIEECDGLVNQEVAVLITGTRGGELTGRLAAR